MSDENVTPDDPVYYGRLAERARMKLVMGTLPREDADRTYAGRGSGFVCSLCDAAVLETEIEYELEYSVLLKPGDSPRTLRFHIGCHQIWDSERIRMAR
jgi:hypothetical protein